MNRNNFEIVRRIGIELGDKNIMVHPIKPGNPLPKIGKVFLCPSYTFERAIEAVRGHAIISG
jgi:hypothetical protein